MIRDKSHMEQVQRWAEFVKNNSRDKWKPAVNDLINSQYEIAARFYKNLEKTEKGREILERLKNERTKVKKNL
ncbi:MAG: hypothetical protein Q7S27_03350 [Nanoarchaeota archaeon]|nr:hypothetical protein [Nanoarchaeota archaeon]